MRSRIARSKSETSLTIAMTLYLYRTFSREAFLLHQDGRQSFSSHVDNSCTRNADEPGSTGEGGEIVAFCFSAPDAFDPPLNPSNPPTHSRAALRSNPFNARPPSRHRNFVSLVRRSSLSLIPTSGPFHRCQWPLYPYSYVRPVQHP